MTEEEKAAQKARPIATNPIPGTPWYADVITANNTSPSHFIAMNLIHFSPSHHCATCQWLCVIRCVVWTGDDRVFFYNPTTRLSMWDRPEELVGRADVDKHIQEPPHKRGSEDSKKTGNTHTHMFMFLASILPVNATMCVAFILFLYVYTQLSIRRSQK